MLRLSNFSHSEFILFTSTNLMVAVLRTYSNLYLFILAMSKGTIFSLADSVHLSVMTATVHLLVSMSTSKTDKCRMKWCINI